MRCKYMWFVIIICVFPFCKFWIQLAFEFNYGKHYIAPPVCSAFVSSINQILSSRNEGCDEFKSMDSCTNVRGLINWSTHLNWFLQCRLHLFVSWEPSHMGEHFVIRLRCNILSKVEPAHKSRYSTDNNQVNGNKNATQFREDLNSKKHFLFCLAYNHKKHSQSIYTSAAHVQNVECVWNNRAMWHWHSLSSFRCN